MYNKTILTLAVATATLALAHEAKAQTNLQVFYDFGKDRGHVTTTVEGFYNDNWGNTFFFVDHDFNNKLKDNSIVSPNGTYMEIARCFNFWHSVPVLNGFSLQAEYNGGIYNQFSINNAFLTGLDYFIHSKDYKNTLNLKVLYKWIDYRGVRESAPEAFKDYNFKSLAPMQFTVVWGLQDLFGAKGLRFSGFADFWWQDHVLFYDEKGNNLESPEVSHIEFISEPQLWYSVGQWFGVPNFNIGGEVELSWDFGSSRGFWVRPCVGAKWVF